MLSDPVAEAFGLIHRHPSGENLWYGKRAISNENKMASLQTGKINGKISSDNLQFQQRLPMHLCCSSFSKDLTSRSRNGKHIACHNGPSRSIIADRTTIVHPFQAWVEVFKDEKAVDVGSAQV